MSTNIHFVATREIQVVKTGGVEVQEEQFTGVWQTPTSVTHKITSQADPIQAYRDWVLEMSEPYQVAVYAHDDFFCDGAPMGTETHNDGEDHCVDFDSWLKDVTDRGYQVTAEAW